MRLSLLKHTLAVLRTTLKLGQKEMAELIGCSTPTIQAIEHGKLKLSEKLGQEIAFKTGVSFEWLMANDVDKPIVEKYGDKFTYEYYVEQKVALIPVSPGTLFYTGVLMGQLFRAMLVAMEKNQFGLFNWRLQNAVQSVIKDFCNDRFFDKRVREPYEIEMKVHRDATMKSFEQLKTKGDLMVENDFKRITNDELKMFKATLDISRNTASLFIEDAMKIIEGLYEKGVILPPEKPADIAPVTIKKPRSVKARSVKKRQ